MDEAKNLYKMLTTPKYSNGHYDHTNLGEDMEAIAFSVGGWWKQRYLLDHRAKTAIEIMDERLRWSQFDANDIDWNSLRSLEEYVVDQAKALSACYPSRIDSFRNGVACVRWQLNPDGRYYMDEDGFGMTDDVEVEIYGFIDRHMNVLVKFQHINRNMERLGVKGPGLKALRCEAERRCQESLTKQH